MIYFDSAATTFQKPPAVEAAMVGALRTMSSPGRGGYPAAMAAAASLLPWEKLDAVCTPSRKRKWKPSRSHRSRTEPSGRVEEASLVMGFI